ncbi:hypothetical protein AAur_3085 [Paenarthrobacter aurescens TC1]|uniref:Uncharacterized protein n=2 Tax=Paenarthrobacter aurescens TaxID=43663 RepID=A1R974_PAEAT|nr:hypothetical protein AAur_3085 [Paenarthrobacter aurescens TC1]
MAGSTPSRHQHSFAPGAPFRRRVRALSRRLHQRLRGRLAGNAASHANAAQKPDGDLPPSGLFLPRSGAPEGGLLLFGEPSIGGGGFRVHVRGGLMLVSRRVLVTSAAVGLMAVSACGSPSAKPDPESVASIQAVIEQAIDRRNHQIVSGLAPSTDEIDHYFAPSAVAATEQEYLKLRRKAEDLLGHGVAFTDSRSEVTIKELTLVDGGAHAIASELTHLSHAPVAGVTGPDEGYVYEQKFELVRVGSEWRIESAGPTNPEAMPPTTVVDPRSEAAAGEAHAK